MGYKLIIIPLIVVFLTQFIKLLIEGIKGNFSWKNLLTYGGMPSSHSALVTSLATIIALNYGINSTGFAISFFLALIVIADAIGFRGYLSQHSRTINKLIIDLPDELEYKYKILNERISHSITQILAGAIIGFILTYLIFIIMK